MATDVRDEYAWAAGFFEGEGSVLMSGGVLAVRLGNTDEEVLRHFHDVIAVGTVYGPYGQYTASTGRSLCGSGTPRKRRPSTRSL